ncbi:hypothetical protein TNCT_232381 [Trichonephila clavata]|uniref:Uncharacterized protein n=1 Tax=Trichonephila clavata TaxID=2740835 RepID=A0A8X6F7V1_TRICU|nr:hypothetical protein TNCT_232381 [Trichonephila clavata]
MLHLGRLQSETQILESHRKWPRRNSALQFRKKLWFLHFCLSRANQYPSSPQCKTLSHRLCHVIRPQQYHSGVQVRSLQ